VSIGGDVLGGAESLLAGELPWEDFSVLLDDVVRLGVFTAAVPL